MKEEDWETEAAWKVALVWAMGALIVGFFQLFN